MVGTKSRGLVESLNLCQFLVKLNAEQKNLQSSFSKLFVRCFGFSFFSTTVGTCVVDFMFVFIHIDFDFKASYILRAPMAAFRCILEKVGFGCDLTDVEKVDFWPFCC